MTNRKLENLEFTTVEANFTFANDRNRAFFDEHGFIMTDIVPMIGAEEGEVALVGMPGIFAEQMDRYIGCEIEMINRYFGTYGMGGAGFVGIKVCPREVEQHEWIVYCVWSAENCIFLKKEGHEYIGLQGNEQLDDELIGKVITNVRFMDNGIIWHLTDGQEKYECLFRYEQEDQERLKRIYECLAPPIEELMLTIYDGTNLLV